ncbi:TPA: hypothetical protein JAG59_002021 [Legionella pneumophila]|nr:hypothetical protein [Legionella pneumophila]HAT5922960.1 hypothetical protein [Legionella pneumophila]HAT5934486.1 hypothetical protein [Legionella pneumophila]HAT5950238.1 hypothetical protein [Legionella pneumophila]HAT5962123.1 hypothetical protein [Legionella pneumophila]
MSNIKINDVFQRIQYAASAGQTQFTIPFPFFDNEYVLVWQNGVELNMGAAPGQYGISGAGSPSGGLITLVTPAALNDIITIQGEMPIDRTSIYSATISNLTGSDLNGDFNREVVMMKQIQTTQALLQLQYAPWLQVSQDPDVTKDRYLPLLAAQQVWRMNEAGNAIEAYTIDNVPAPSNAPFVIYEDDPSLENPQNLGALSSGILKQTVAAGSATLAIAQNAVDYWKPGDTLTVPGVPTNPNDATSKQYVDSIAGGFSLIFPVVAATTANFSSTYNNGVSGVGATLTANSNGVATIDGVTLSLSDRVLFKNQTNAFENGIYEVTNVGSVSTQAVYTRTTDYDTPAEIVPGTLVPVTDGSTNINTLWLETATVTTVGTDSIIFIQYGIVASDIVTITGTQTITGDKTFTGLVEVPTPSTGTEAANKDYVDNTSAFASGTKMLFVQTSAPTGWTKDTVNNNNSALRVVTGSASTGGTVDFTTAFTSQAVAGTVGNTTLTESQMPAHVHLNNFGGGVPVGSGASVTVGGTALNTGVTGGGNSHNHSFTGTAINLAVKYVDVIIATKD